MKTALIIVDLQNDYFAGGRMELVNVDAASANAANLLDTFRNHNMPTFHIQHLFKGPDAPFFAENTSGAEIHSSIAPLDSESVIQKTHPNSFNNTGLNEKLKLADIQRLVICGAMSHMCIDATTRAAADLGYKCLLTHDACATRDVEFNGRTVAAADVHASYMAALGWIYADVMTTDEAISAIK